MGPLPDKQEHEVTASDFTKWREIKNDKKKYTKKFRVK